MASSSNSDGDGGRLNIPPQLTAAAPPGLNQPVTLSKAFSHAQQHQLYPQYLSTKNKNNNINNGRPSHSLLSVSSLAHDGATIRQNANDLASIATTASNIFNQSTTPNVVAAVSTIADAPTFFTTATVT